MKTTQMTVRDFAYRETLDWLLNDKEGPEPCPPEGLHELSRAAWYEGRDEAVAAYSVDEEWFDLVIDAVVAVVKVSVLYGLFSIGNHIDTWWAMLLSALVGVFFVWKFWTYRGEA